MSLYQAIAFQRDAVVSQPGRHWVVCQLGARENYMVPRALASTDRLAALITDTWCEPHGLVACMSERLSGRYHHQLVGARVETMRCNGIADAIYGRCFGERGWRGIINRNVRFGQSAARHLRTLVRSGVRCDTVFAYSYAAAAIFKEARSLGLATVLGQIDPGPLEDEIVRECYRDAGQIDRYEGTPPDYWSRWREEIALADIVIANSAWSASLLVRAGVPDEKMIIVPLAHERPASALRGSRSVPDAFTSERPLRLLFLGQVTFRKGIGQLLEAFRRMPTAPLRLDIVGEMKIDLPDAAAVDERIAIYNAVPRGAVYKHYEVADLFVFPTLSDGFGLTQLEALAHGLPVLTSRNCGNIVVQGFNGAVLDEVTPQAIEAVLRQILVNPDHLRHWSAYARVPPAFSKEALAATLSTLKIGR